MIDFRNGLKSPTCGECAMAKGLHVPGDIHTCSIDICANCKQMKACSPAEDWYPEGKEPHWSQWD